MKKIIVAALLFTTPAHAVGYQVYGGMIHLGMPKALDVFNLDWEFANDPGWGYEIFDCSLKGYVLASFQAWQTRHTDPLPPIVPPPLEPIPPIVNPIIPIVPTPIPEASTWFMMLMGFSALSFIGWRRRVPGN